MTLIQDIADRFCSHRPQLRPFTRGDWAAYNGCESLHPEIAETDEATVILDGNAVEVVLHLTEEEQSLNYGGDIFAAEFADEAEARVAAEFLVVNPGFAPRLLGECVGRS